MQKRLIFSGLHEKYFPILCIKYKQDEKLAKKARELRKNFGNFPHGKKQKKIKTIEIA